MSQFRKSQDLRPKGRGRRLVAQGEMCLREYVARPFECHFLTWNQLPFDVADTWTAAYHDILARMHHKIIPQTSRWYPSIPASTLITFLVVYLPNAECPNQTRFGWATLQPSDWTSFSRPFLVFSCPRHIYIYIIYILYILYILYIYTCIYMLGGALASLSVGARNYFLNIV